MNKNIKNILITGASSGIGEALALYYAEQKVTNLFLCGRNAQRFSNVADACARFGVNVHTEILDVVNRQTTAEWIEKCEKNSPLNLIIANGGVSAS